MGQTNGMEDDMDTTILLKEAEQKIVKLTADENEEITELADRQGEDMGKELSE